MGFGSMISNAASSVKKTTVDTSRKVQGKDKIEKLEKELKHQKKANKDLKKQLDSERTEHKETKSELALISAKLDETEDAVEGEKDEVEALRETVAQLTADLEKAELDSSRLRSALRDAEETHAAYVEDVEAAQDEEAEAKAAEEAAKAAEELAAMEADAAQRDAAKTAAVAAYEAMDKFNTDVTGLCRTLAVLDTETLQLVKATYFAEYGHSLHKRITKKTSGLTRTFLLGLINTRIAYFSGLIKNAISGLTTDDHAVAEIIAQLTKDEITELLEANPELLGKLQSCLSGNTRKFVLTLLQNQREDSEDVDAAAVTEDAETLFKNGQGKMVGVNSDPFKEVLALRSAAHLRALNIEYKKHNKKEKTLEEAIRSLFGGSQKMGYVTSLRFQMDPARCAAIALEKAFDGLGCDEEKVLQILRLNRQADRLDHLKASYNGMNSKPLMERLKSELSGLVFTGPLVKGVFASMGEAWEE